MRRLLATVTALASAVAFALSFGTAGTPARAELSLGTYIVTFDAPPTAEQVKMLSGVAVGVHGFAHVPVAVAVALPANVGLLGNLPGVRRVFPNTG
ncbi:MAG: hypothetical protein WDA71_13875, partial [Actinomycetota bacterium]